MLKAQQKLFILIALWGLLWLTPIHYTLGNDPTTYKREIKVELEEVLNAKSYEIELTSKDTSKKQMFKMKKPLWRANIKPGVYSFKLRSVDQRGVSGVWSKSEDFSVLLPKAEITYPVHKSEIKTHTDKNYKLTIRWKNILSAKNYRAEITSINTKQKYLSSFEKNVGIFELPVAQKYQLQVTPIASSGKDGEVMSSPIEFSLIGEPLKSIEIDTPEDIWVQKLSWSQPDFTNFFTYKIQKSINSKTSSTNNKKWETVEFKPEYTNSSTNFSYGYKGGHYRLLIKASGSLREDSLAYKKEFDVYYGDRRPAAAEDAKLRYSFEKPTPWFFIASYLVTNIQYSASNPESTTAPNLNYSAAGGTGRIGLGYIPKYKSNGYFGIFDMSGFNVENSTQTYSAAEFHYLQKRAWNQNLLRLSGGLFYKELVESKQTSVASNTFTHDKISYLGPHIGVEYMHPFTKKIGMQLNTRIYYSLIGLKTPNGLSISPELFYQLGLMGSYKITPTVSGYLGWAQRLDQISYKSTPSNGTSSFAPAGASQHVEITGNYLNFLLEWAF
jgi:hypothetical protein